MTEGGITATVCMEMRRKRFSFHPVCIGHHTLSTTALAGKRDEEEGDGTGTELQAACSCARQGAAAEEEEEEDFRGGQAEERAEAVAS